MGEYVNSKQARFDKSHVSCGVVEVHHLPDEQPIDTVFSIANHLYNKANGRPGAFILWSDVIGGKQEREKGIADILAKMNVGTLMQSEQEVNPKTGHLIQVWLFHLSHEPFRKWYTDEYVNRITES
jgi:hypothetical protein